MTYTLDICGERRLKDPTEATVEAAVGGLDAKKGDAFLVLSTTDMDYIQTSGDARVGFDLEYQERDTDHHYRAKGTLTAAEVVRALVSYRRGDAQWKEMAEWEHVSL
jgi:hypothetical protein